MKTIVIANGDLSKQKIDFSEYDFIVATDGGANHLVNLKIKPDIIIGDFDSISKKAIKKFDDVEQIRVYNQNKTDLEKALDYLMEEKCEIVDIFGATSNERIDHTLANIFLLKNYSDLN
ncbi:MAG: thiamine diphosphokinase, partial [Patescibacteria group bacterium]